MFKKPPKNVLFLKTNIFGRFFGLNQSILEIFKISLNFTFLDSIINKKIIYDLINSCDN